MERDLTRVSEPWDGIRPSEIRDHTKESRHAEDEKQGGAYCSVLLQKRGVNGPQPLLPFGAIVIFEFHDASV
jgi:hypothetical protein